MNPSAEANRVYDEVTEQFVQKQEWTIETSGSNLLDVMANPYVDQERLYTNDVTEVLSVFDIEAARSALYREIHSVLTSTNGDVNYRHLSLLVDTMTNRGHMVSINRHGINKGPSGEVVLLRTDRHHAAEGGHVLRDG
jgi:DNA-directed RNA polymerase II subunit RPB1